MDVNFYAFDFIRKDALKFRLIAYMFVLLLEFYPVSKSLKVNYFCFNLFQIQISFSLPFLYLFSSEWKFWTFWVTGQVGAIQLGISRALQNWEPDLRPPLRACKIKQLHFLGQLWLEWYIRSIYLFFFFIDQIFLFYSDGSWFLDSRCTCCWKKEARKGESKKELPMGETLGYTCVLVWNF